MLVLIRGINPEGLLDTRVYVNNTPASAGINYFMSETPLKIEISMSLMNNFNFVQVQSLLNSVDSRSSK